jgi:hypothetical protein
MSTEIERRYRAVAKQYEELKAEAERLVVRWRYSNGHLWHYEPEAQLTTDEVGEQEQAKHWFGYDCNNRVVCLRQYDELTAYRRDPARPDELAKPVRIRELRIEWFISHTHEKLEVFDFVTPHYTNPEDVKTELRYVEWVWLQAGKLQDRQRFGRGGDYAHYRYKWDGQTLHLTQLLDEKGTVKMEFEKGENGQDLYYKVRKDGTRFLLGQPLPVGLTAKKLTETIRARLLETIPATVKAVKIKAPIYCVALAYDGEGNEALPPCLGLGLESERKGWLKTHGKDAKHMVWNPAEFQHYETNQTQFDDDQLEEACEWLNGELENKGSHAPAKRLLVEVAAELNKLDWSKFAKVTPDLIVYAVDFELGDLNKNLKKILPARRLAALKAAKLL